MGRKTAVDFEVMPFRTKFLQNPHACSELAKPLDSYERHSR